MSTFNICIDWDSVNKDTERAWVARILRTMSGPDDARMGVDDYSRHLRELREDTDNFEALTIKVTSTEESLCVCSACDDVGRGDVDNACQFIAAFLEHWRPNLAVKVVWTSKDAAGRTQRGTHIVGPKGITVMRGYRHGKHAPCNT